jgi:hypothetical protein
VVVVAWSVGSGHIEIGLRDRLDESSLCRDVSPDSSGVCRCVTNCREHPILHDMRVIFIRILAG